MSGFFGIITKSAEDPKFRVHLSPRYLEILEQLLAATGATRRLVPDATIAALAMENGAEVQTNNGRDFQRFPGLM